MRLSRNAQISLDEIIEYTKNNWGKSELHGLKKRIQNLFNVLQSNPCAFKIHENNNRIRKAMLLDDISVFYEINDNTVDVLLFWHNSRNPENLKL